MPSSWDEIEEIDNQVNRAISLISCRPYLSQVRQHLRQAYPDLSQQQIQDRIDRAQETIRKRYDALIAEEGGDTLRCASLAFWEDVISNEAVPMKFRLVAAANRDKLMGLHKPLKIKVETVDAEEAERFLEVQIAKAAEERQR